MLDRLEKVFHEVFENQRLKLDEKMTYEDIPGWDSMAHVNLCLAIEEEFEIQLTVKEMSTITSIEAILAVLSLRSEK